MMMTTVQAAVNIPIQKTQTIFYRDPEGNDGQISAGNIINSSLLSFLGRSKMKSGQKCVKRRRATMKSRHLSKSSLLCKVLSIFVKSKKNQRMFGFLHTLLRRVNWGGVSLPGLYELLADWCLCAREKNGKVKEIGFVKDLISQSCSVSMELILK